jgi:hypothetical protein
LSQFFLNPGKNNILQVIALGLHIRKGAADEDGEGSPGGIGIHIDD